MFRQNEKKTEVEKKEVGITLRRSAVARFSLHIGAASLRAISWRISHDRPFLLSGGGEVMRAPPIFSLLEKEVRDSDTTCRPRADLNLKCLLKLD